MNLMAVISFSISSVVATWMGVLGRIICRATISKAERNTIIHHHNLYFDRDCSRFFPPIIKYDHMRAEQSIHLSDLGEEGWTMRGSNDISSPEYYPWIPCATQTREFESQVLWVAAANVVVVVVVADVAGVDARNVGMTIGLVVE